MKVRNRQRGVALFTAIFLVAVIALVAGAVAVTITTQQTAAARALDAESAYWAAMARLERSIRDILDAENCTGTGQQQLNGFQTNLECEPPVTVEEAGDTYNVYVVRTTAWRGDLQSGTLVRRSIRTQFRDN